MIRPIKSSDIEKIREFIVKTDMFRPDEVECAVELMEEAVDGNEDYVTYVYEEDKKILGYICYGAASLGVGVYDLYWICVSSDAQGKGVGSKLMQFMESELGKLNARIIIIETSSPEKYLPTQKFYEKNGYKLEATIKDYYMPSDDKLIYAKRL